MPELPDITVAIEALEKHILGERLERVTIASPFVLRSVDPPLSEAEGRRVCGLRRLGKRIVIELEGGIFLVLHLMILGRLRWRDGEGGSSRSAARRESPGKTALASFEFTSGTLVFVESGTKKRASLHIVRGEAALAEHDRGGLEVLEADARAFARVLASENHTLKRALTDPTLFSGIGNAYSDEILHRARLSPLALTASLEPAEVSRLRKAARETLVEWTRRLRRKAGGAFPERMTAFHAEMAVHGRYGEPCPVCASEIQRIVYAENECNYCPRCQTQGKLLADRALSRLLHRDWPKTIEELEGRRRG